ncbi:MAG: hypothetical protein KJ058_11680 [Thermoanaerobaculia bacterium]|nr:hypothetical protein [Thermoanaerobaculia bacterium]
MKRPWRASTYLAGVTLFALASIAAKCTITVAPGEQTGNLNLNIPYRSQPEGSMLCGPACVLMWRLYDKLPERSIYEISSGMGCGSYNGCSPAGIANGVNGYTRTYDAHDEGYWDGPGSDLADLQAWLHSRQLHSLARGFPVITTILGGLHAVVPNRGNFSTAPDGTRRWDYVFVHDPYLSEGPDRYYVAGQWMDAVEDQIISSSALMGWEGSFASYANIRVRGWWGTSNGPYIPVP